MENEPTTSSSLRNKIKQTLCCFSSNRRVTSEPPSSAASASSVWLKSKVHEIPEMKAKCRNIINRIGKHRHHRRLSSADFHYDPISYSLNFEDGNDDHHLDEFPLRNLSSRLPAPMKLVAAEPLPRLMVSREITAFS